MDHAMRFIYEYMRYSIDELHKENESGKYSKLSKCPSYKEVKAYCNSYNALVDYYYADDKEDKRCASITPSRLMKGW